MKNTRVLRYVILFIAVAAAVYDLMFFVRLYQYPHSLSNNEILYGYWALPVAMVFLFLYAYLNKPRR
ncbi:hypothetical protein [Pelotomaculum propionicicum]|uniref:Uncharacterized protein n=1 Tax=Pelotomaculum propionicicum TaxID=258475 RepID=A0A4Y7RBZ8_9FIRM|nr:hypothetical protein [Pelotomaculum propionicicum]NLI13896.1 hypothetical protein [Peptococcaceae bacterium]TEB06289.1 hypothetical protein Pmgp_03792 [Pelotomaculum propionicicum]